MAFDDWSDLRFVLAVHRHGSLTAAATALGVNQTTVSRRLRSLEQRTGVTVFERLRDGVLFTPAGSVVVQTAEQIEQAILGLERQTLGENTPLTGTLRVTLPEVLAAAWVHAFTSFTSQYPEVELVIRASDDLLSVTRREADIAVRTGPNPPQHLVGRRIARMALASYTGIDVPEGTPLPWIGWETGSTANAVLQQWRSLHSDASPVALRVDRFHVLVEALRRGHGQGLLPCGCADGWAGLRRNSAPHRTLRPELWLLTHPDLKRVPRVRALMDHLGNWLTERRERIDPPA